MSKVGIVADSASCLPPELIERYDIRIAPVILIINGKSYQDQIDITADEFYRLQKESKTAISTSAVAPGVFADIYKSLAEQTDKIICLPHSSGLGATCESAMQARDIVKQELPDVSIEVIDTRTAAGAQGFVVLEAARAVAEGKSFAEVVEVTQAMVSRVKWLVALETLTYLIRGGRAPKFAGSIANLIQMKPIIGMTNGGSAVDFSDKVRTFPKAMARLVEIVKKQVEPGKPVHFMVHYSDSIEKGEHLKQMLAAEFECEEVYINHVTPAISCHMGPVVGLSFYC